MKTHTLKLLFVLILLILFTEFLQAKCSTTATSQRTLHTNGIPGNPAIRITSTATSICYGTPVTFTAIVTGETSSAIWTWMKNNKKVTTIGAFYTDASLVDKDVISFILVTPGLGAPPDTLTSNAIAMKVSRIVNTLKDTVKADADTVLLDAGAGFSRYRWNSGDTTQKIIVTEFGKYTVTITNFLGCTASFSSYVSMVKARILTNDTAVCKGSLVSVTLGHIKDLYDTTIVDRFTINTIGYYNKVIKTSDEGRYFFKVSGTFNLWVGTWDPLDGYYTLSSPAPKYTGGLTMVSNYATSPSPIGYNPSHIYTSSIIHTDTVPIKFTFVDGLYKDNAGSLNFIIYKVSPRPVVHILWSTGDTTESIHVYPMVTTTYKVTVTDGLTTSRDSITVQADAPVTPSITIKASSMDSCVGKPISFTAKAVNGGNIPYYQWQLNGKSAGVNSSSYTTTELVDKDEVACELTSKASCLTNATANSSKLPISIHPYITPAVTITSSATEICGGSSVHFTASTVNEGNLPGYQWLVNNRAVGSNQSDYSTTSLANSDIVRCVTSVNSFLHCLTAKEALSDPITITVNPEPKITVNADKELLKGQETQLNSSIACEASLQWTPATYLSNDTISNPTLTPLQNINYTLKAVTTKGCTSFAVVHVKVFQGLKIPNVFSPNGDGINDTWMISGFGDFPRASVAIFNRYGQPVFQCYGYNIPWNGNMNGSPLPVATYYYVINLGNQFQPMSGSVTVLR